MFKALLKFLKVDHIDNYLMSNELLKLSGYTVQANVSFWFWFSRDDFLMRDIAQILLELFCC